jgi:hypothetical protein
MENGEETTNALETHKNWGVSVKHMDVRGGCGGAERIDVITDKVRIISQVGTRRC